MIKRTNMTKTECYSNYLSNLKLRRVGNHEIKSLASKEYYGGRNRREVERRCRGVEEEVVRILGVREQREAKNLKEVTKRAKASDFKLKNIMKEMQLAEVDGVSREEAVQRHKQEVTKEVRLVWRVYSDFFRGKVVYMINKFKLKKKATENPRWKGVLVTREQLEEEERRRGLPPSCNYIILDNIPMDEDELAYLKLPHKFREIEPIKVEDIELEAEVNTVKQRWDLMDKEGDEEEEKEDEEGGFTEEEKEERRRKREEERKRRKEERKEAKSILDEKSKCLDMSKLKATDLDFNQRVYEPRAASGGEEIQIQAQKLEVLNQAKKLLKDNNSDTNLTAQTKVGKLKLLRRKRSGELVIFPTDKSGKLVVCLPETYLAAGRVHTSKDMQVGLEELPPTETKVNRHTRALTKIVNLGTSHNGQEQRIAGATKSVDSPAPSLYLLWKDHKQYETVPPTRPVCAATVGPLARASELSSLILTAFLDSMLPGTECLSSEEMQRAILDANIVIQEGWLKVEVFSMDVSALYPSLHIDDILEAVMQLILESDISVECLDTKEMGKYLAVMLEQEEIEARGLVPHIPRRTVIEEGAATKRPTIAYLDSERYVCRKRGQPDTSKPKWSWGRWKEPRERQRKLMFALVMREQIKMIITNHL